MNLYEAQRLKKEAFSNNRRTIIDSCLVEHWLNNGPKLLEALKAVNDMGYQDSPSVWRLVEEAIESAERVELI